MKRSDAWKSGMDAGFDALQAAEAEVFGGGGPARPFRFLGRWIVAEDAPADPHQGGGVLDAMRQEVSLLSRLKSRLAPRLMLRSRAAAILVKSNLRAFYPAERATLKIANPTRGNARSRLQNEIARRRELRDTARVKQPKLLLTESGAPDFIFEEMVAAQKLATSVPQPAFLAERLVEFQRANGGEIVDARLLFPFERSLALLSDWLRGRTVPESRNILERLERLLERDSLPMAVALCNNDLTWSNLLTAGDLLYVIDWEYAGRAPCFVDAVRLATQIDGYGRAYQEAIGAQMPGMRSSALAAKEQFLIAALLVCGQRIERRADFSDGASRAAYETRLADRLTRFLRLMQALAK